MKKLLIPIVILPLISFAQDVPQTDNATPLKNEIGFNVSVAPEILQYSGLVTTWLAIRLSYLHNFKNTQIGLMVEGGQFDYMLGSITTAVILNRKFPVGKSYLYAGGIAGHYYAEEISDFTSFAQTERGYSLGLQAGLSLRLSNRFSFVSEVGVRSTQVWFDNYYHVPAVATSFAWEEAYIQKYTDNRFFMTVPMTIGIRYRF